MVGLQLIERYAMKKHADKYIFYACLIASIVLLSVSFVLPPTGVIDPSVLKAVGLLLGFAALGIAGQNLANGKDVIFKKDDIEVTIGEEEGK